MAPRPRHRNHLPAPRPAANTRTTACKELPMVAIGVIALFIIAILGLNLYEFGRID
ncbi:MAG: hypothetical protein KF842_12575 [Caulobacter sp.]|nr:hypothetical protein [Caulobacter sp.]